MSERVDDPETMSLAYLADECAARAEQWDLVDGAGQIAAAWRGLEVLCTWASTRDAISNGVWPEELVAAAAAVRDQLPIAGTGLAKSGYCYDCKYDCSASPDHHPCGEPGCRCWCQDADSGATADSPARTHAEVEALAEDARWHLGWPTEPTTSDIDALLADHQHLRTEVKRLRTERDEARRTGAIDALRMAEQRLLARSKWAAASVVVSGMAGQIADGDLLPGGGDQR